MWTMMEIPPQPFGECSLCKRHTCGEYKDEDGVTRQKWLHSPIELDRGGNLVIGYQCVQTMSEELGITKRIVEVEKHIEPTDEHIVNYIRKSINRQPVGEGKDVLQANIDHIMQMDKGQLKAYLAEQKVEFVPQWGEDKLREAAIAHIKGASV